MPYDWSKPLFFPDSDTKKRKASFGGSKSALEVDIVDELRDCPFYCGQSSVENPTPCLHHTPCFNHRVGLPVKDGTPLPIFDYETYLFNDMEGIGVTSPRSENKPPQVRTLEGIGINRNGCVKYLAIKKSRGLGVTEFFLRYIAWLAICRNHIYKNMRFFIVCGPGENVAEDLIKRIKSIVSPLGIIEDTQKTVFRFKSVEIVAKPGAHVDSLRGYKDVKFILIDEASFWVGEDQSREIRSVVEGYIAKSHPTIAMISTPNIPSTMFENIMEEPPETCLYKRYFMPYTVGLNKIYTEEDIEIAKRSPSFEREYNLKYGMGIGNIFTDEDIDSIVIPFTYNDDPTMKPLVTDGVGNNKTQLVPAKVSVKMTCIGVDPGFGSSLASFVVLGWLGEPIDKIIVLDAQKFKHDSFREFTDHVYNVFQYYQAQKIFVDASARDVVTDLKISLREQTEYEYVKKEAHANYSYDPDSWMQRMIVCPINFSQYNDEMLRRLVAIVMNKHLLIPKQFDSLILDMRMAREKNGKLDKSGANTLDLFDALRLACLMFQYQ